MVNRRWPISHRFFGRLIARELLQLPDEPARVLIGVPRPVLAAELLHLPGEPAGVVFGVPRPVLATELLQLPGKPAGVVIGVPRPVLAAELLLKEQSLRVGIGLLGLLRCFRATGNKFPLPNRWGASPIGGEAVRALRSGGLRALKTLMGSR